jgi:hypothetical protein
VAGFEVSTEVSAPSPVHSIACNIISTGVKCKLGPVDGQGNYKIVLATNVQKPPHLSIAGRNVSLATLQEITDERNSLTNPARAFGLVAVVVVGVSLLFLLSWVESRLGRQPTVEELERLIAGMRAQSERIKSQSQ